mgnify:CR=1 FL=1
MKRDPRNVPLPTLAMAAALVLLSGGTVDTASAATYSYAAEPASSVVAPGGTITVDIFLVEELQAGDTSSPLDDAGGLFSFDFQLEALSGPARIADAADLVPDPDFDDTTAIVREVTDTLGLEGYLSHGVGFDLQNPTPVGVGFENGTKRVRLGQVSLTLSGTGTATTSYTVSDWDGGNNTLFADGSDLDDTSITPATFNVAVPEPATAAVMVIGGGALLMRRSRR